MRYASRCLEALFISPVGTLGSELAIRTARLTDVFVKNIDEGDIAKADLRNNRAAHLGRNSL